MQTSHRKLNISVALGFTLGAMAVAYARIGLPPVVIVGGSGLIGLWLWVRTYLDEPLDPRIILPPFLLTSQAWRHTWPRNI